MLISFWGPVSFFLFLLWRWGWGGGCCYRFLYLYVCMYVCMYIILQDDTSLEKQISGLLHLSVERVLLLRSNPSCCIISCRWVRFLYITVCDISVCSVCTCKFSQGGRELHGEKKVWMWPWVLNWDSSTAWMGRLLSRVWVFFFFEAVCNAEMWRGLFVGFEVRTRWIWDVSVAIHFLHFTILWELWDSFPCLFVIC